MYLALFVVSSIIVSSSIDARTVTKKCSVNINGGLATPQPLYFYSNTTDFVETTAGTSEIHLDSNEKIELFCSNGFRPPYGNESLTATCIADNQFQINNKSAKLIDVVCNNYPHHTTRVSERKCSVGNIVEIGFQVKGTWVSVLEICYDNQTGSTLWSHLQLKPNNNYHQRNVERIPFIQGNFYPGINCNSLYSKFMQRKTIGHILGSDKLASDIISNTSDLYLARGHLTAKADYVFAALQLTTFYFINVAPQWQSFNNGNWLHVEIGIRKFIAKRNIDTEVYTGTHGICTLPDINNKTKPLFLALGAKPHVNRIPVPRLYYKVIIAESIDAGIVLIGVNNPYVSINSIDEYILCPDISDKVNYIGWDRKNITAGYSYACSVSDFVKKVTSLPQLPTVNNLLI